ncbi:MAG: hypothetical protein WC415_03530 [Patescibacteria group bacterium]
MSKKDTFWREEIRAKLQPVLSFVKILIVKKLKRKYLFLKHNYAS